MRLDGHTALITGGTQGVGAAIAIRLAQAGCNLVLHGLKEDTLAEQTIAACRDEGSKVEPIFSDLALPASECVPKLMSHATIQKASISILVNNAGTFCDLPFLEMSSETFDRTFQLNVAAGYFLTQAFAKQWIANGLKGRVLFTGSINGFLAEADHTAYDASKGAVHSLVRSLCVALAPYGIRVNAIAPGLVKTPLTAAVLDDGSASKRWMELHTPNQTVPGPESCAGAALFLVSDEAEHIQGQTLLIDGGMSAWQQPDLPEQLRGHLGE